MKRKSFPLKISAFILFFGIVFCLIAHISQSNTEKVQAADTMTLTYISVFIKADDTLWSLAEEYHTSPCGSIKEYVNEIKRCNDLQSDDIYAGNHIVIPVYVSANPLG